MPHKALIFLAEKHLNDDCAVKRWRWLCRQSGTTIGKKAGFSFLHSLFSFTFPITHRWITTGTFFVAMFFFSFSDSVREDLLWLHTPPNMVGDGVGRDGTKLFREMMIMSSSIISLFWQRWRLSDWVLGKGWGGKVGIWCGKNVAKQISDIRRWLEAIAHNQGSILGDKEKGRNGEGDEG